MWTLILSAALLAPAPRVTGGGETVKVGKLTGTVVEAGGTLDIEVSGPTTLVVDIRGLKGDTVTLTVDRDGARVSSTPVVLKPGVKPAARGWTAGAKVGFEVPAGKHLMQVQVSSRALIVATAARGLPKGVLAADAAGAAEAGEPTEATASAAPASPSDAPAAPGPRRSAGESDDAEAAALAAAHQNALDTVRTAAGDTAAPRPAGSQALRIAVYDYELSGVEPSIGAIVTDSTLAEIRKLSGVSAIGMNEIRDMLSHEADKQYVGCEGSESCLAEIAGALGVDELISGKIAKVEGGEVFVLRRIDQRRARIAGVVDKRLKAESGQELLAAIGPAIAELYPERPVREGATRGVAKEVAMRLDPPPLPTWSFYTVGGTGVVAGVTAAIFGLLARSAETRFNEQVALAQTQVVPGRNLVDVQNEARRDARYSNYSLMAAGVCVLSAGVMAFFTDWHGYGDAAAAHR